MKQAVLISTLIGLCLIAYSTAGARSVAAEAQVAVADTVETTKERVKKKPAKTKRTSPDKTTYAREPTEETSFMGSCLYSIFSGMLESICSSMGSGDAEPAVESHVDNANNVSSLESTPEFAHYQGTIDPSDPGKDSIELWNIPGGYRADGYMIRKLSKGAEVEVVQFNYYKDVLWVMVTSGEPGSLGGWVEEMDVTPIHGAKMEESGRVNLADDSQEIIEEDHSEQYSVNTNAPIVTTNAPIATTKSPAITGESPKLFFLTEFIYPEFIDEYIREEYKLNVYRFGADIGFFVSKSINIGVTFDYLYSKGEPQYDYEVAEFRDSPRESRLRVVNYGIQFGQLFLFNNNKGFFSYGIAPTVFGVKEHALIKEYESDVLVGERDEELSKWKFGGEIKITAGMILAGKVPLGFNVQYSLFPWESEMEKSLTLDYLDSNSISMISYGISIGFLSF